MLAVPEPLRDTLTAAVRFPGDWATREFADLPCSCCQRLPERESIRLDGAVRMRQ